jgi:hypothetical protein
VRIRGETRAADRETGNGLADLHRIRMTRAIPRRPSMLRFALCSAVLITAMLPADASSPRGDWYAIERHAAHAGGTSRATGGGYELSGTAGQPAPGPSGGGGYTLDAGFIWPIQATPVDGVFQDGFEVP